MAIPQLNNEGVDQSGGSVSLVIFFSGFSWAANDIIELIIATDGWVPVMTTANGFALAQDPVGNTASVTTNGGTAGSADCGIFVFWKRATGNSTATDPPPVFQAPSVSSGTSWCCQPNSFSGARTTGTPYHVIATGIVSSATTAVTSVAATSTLANCLFMPRVASSTDDQAFNDWTFTGSAGPSGSGPPNTGWHDSSGNASAFTGCEGGFAAAGGPHTATTTFSASTKQASVTLVMASLAEAGALVDDDPGIGSRQLVRPTLSIVQLVGDELPVQSSGVVDDDGARPVALQVVPAGARTIAGDDELPIGAAPSVVDEDGARPAQVMPVAIPSPALRPTYDEIPTAAIIDEDGQFSAPLQLVAPALRFLATDDEFPGGSLPSGLAEDVGVLVFAPQPPLPSIPFPVAVEEIPPQPGVTGIGGASDAQRSFLAPPQTGTLSTVAPLPAWTTSHAYVIDPSQGSINRVQNGGGNYQCTQDGTSSSGGGGPTGTGTAISDGSTMWRYIGPVQTTNTVAGSQILCAVMRGNESQAATVQPTDNDSGGTYTLITDNEYGAFAGSFAGVWRRPTASNSKTNFQTSGVWGGSGGAGDEMSICWIELQGVLVGAPHAFSHVERLASSGGTVTAGPITTTKRCLIVSYWFGNGTVQTAGQPDAATPAGGLTLIAGSTGELSLTTAGYVQHMVAWRMANPGTFSEVWTASPTDEGAQLVTIAYEDLNAPTISVDDWAMPAPRVSAAAVQLWSPIVTDEFAPPSVLSDEGQVMPALGTPTLAAPAALAADELAIIAVEDDVAPLAALPVTVTPLLQPLLSGDDVVVAALEESGALPTMQAVAMPLLAGAPADDELPVTLIVLFDETGALLAVSWSAPALVGRAAADDELPVAVALTPIVDEDQLLAPLLWQVASPLWTLIATDELPKKKGKSVSQAPSGTSLLDGPIAKQVAQALIAAKLVKPAVLIKVTPGVRTPGAVSAGTNPTTQSYKAKGIEQNLLALQLAGTLISGVDAAIRLFGATIEDGQVPEPNDRIVMAGRTYTIVKDGVSRDPAAASYLAQCKL